jgi:hypothetical protein
MGGAGRSCIEYTKGGAAYARVWTGFMLASERGNSALLGMPTCTDSGHIGGGAAAPLPARRQCGWVRKIAAPEWRSLNSARPARHPEARTRSHD